MSRRGAIGAWSAFAALVVLALAGSAGAQEYKLVLTPEAGQAPPARVCLVSRSARMKADRASGLVKSLAERVRCGDDGCEAERDTRPARCRQCPESAHPGCRALLDLGERAADDYSVVCADDDVRHPDGGTVYISVESVEAENPPRFYGFEVSGGRVRWSAFERISRPSYRVLGGDFESSRLSYPRGASAEPWAQVPVSRRCRCVDVQIGRGSGAIERVRVDDAPTCRGDVNAGGLLPVEVPAVEVDRVRTLVVEGERDDGGARWPTRWPTVPMQLAPQRFEFDWLMPCMWPRLDQCPSVSIQGARCSEATPVPDGATFRCPYECEVISDLPMSPPFEMLLHLEDPTIDITGVVGAVGQRMIGRLPAADRVVRIDISGWGAGVPGDRIHAVQVVGSDGSRTTAELSAVEGDWVTLPVHGAFCDASVRVEVIGERDHIAGFGRIQRGARLDLPPPAELGLPAKLIFGLGGGLATVVAVEANRETHASFSYAIIDTVGVRLRPQASPWFAEAQVLGMFVGDWPYTPITADGGGSVTNRHHYISVGGELVGGRTLLAGGRIFHLRAGLGAGVGFDPFADGGDEVVEQGRAMGTWSVGASTPLTTAVDNLLGIRVELRHWFGSRTLHFTIDDDIAIARHAEPAHAFMLNALLTFEP